MSEFANVEEECTFWSRECDAQHDRAEKAEARFDALLADLEVLDAESRDGLVRIDARALITKHSGPLLKEETYG